MYRKTKKEIKRESSALLKQTCDSVLCVGLRFEKII